MSVAALGVALAAAQLACSHECGDRGRGALLLLAMASPLAVLGAIVVTGSLRRALAGGRPPAPSWRLVALSLRALLYTGGAAAACIAVVLLAGAVNGLTAPTVGSGRLDFGALVVMAVVGEAWGALAVLASRSARRTTELLRSWPAPR